MVSTTRIDTSDSERARSFARSTICAALDAGRRFDFVARDHRPRIGRHDCVDTEVRQLLFDQPRCEIESVGGHGLDAGVRFVQQFERRQPRGRGLGKQRNLAFLLLAFGGRHARRRPLDVHDLVLVDLFARRRQGRCTFFGRGGADRTILLRLARGAHGIDQALEAPPQAFGHGQPREPECQARTDGARHHQHHRAPVAPSACSAQGEMAEPSRPPAAPGSPRAKEPRRVRAPLLPRATTGNPVRAPRPKASGPNPGPGAGARIPAQRMWRQTAPATRRKNQKAGTADRPARRRHCRPSCGCA